MSFVKYKVKLMVSHCLEMNPKLVTIQYIYCIYANINTSHAGVVQIMKFLHLDRRAGKSRGESVSYGPYGIHYYTFSNCSTLKGYLGIYK